MISFTCPSCKQSLEVEDRGKGLKVPCPVCHAEVTIPHKGRSIGCAPYEEVVSATERGQAASCQLTPPMSRTQTRNVAAGLQPGPILLGALWVSVALSFFAFLGRSGTAFVFGLAGAILSGVLLLLRSNIRKAKMAGEKAIAMADIVVKKHANALLINRLRKRKFDDYGNVVEEQWRKEIDYFCAKVLWPSLGNSYGPLVQGLSWKKYGLPIDTKFVGSKPAVDACNRAIYDWIDGQLDEYSETKLFSNINVSTLDPTGYEAYCTHVLNESGWQATMTKATGDQGIDIVATRNGKKAVFQCKLYSSPVGNDAVQEANAGRAFAKADYAFVVSNTEFTPAAIELANTCAVHLIHHTNLADLDRHLRS
jgi:restriction system protein